MRTKTIDVIAIPLGTRLTSLAISNDGEVFVWIANKDRSVPYDEWQGTYLHIKPDGSVTRITRDDAIPNGEDVFMIKEKRDE